MITVTVTGDCVGTGQCHLLAPDLFTLDEEGLASTLVDMVTGEATARAERAARACPMGAIEIGRA